MMGVIGWIIGSMIQSDTLVKTPVTLVVIAWIDELK